MFEIIILPHGKTLEAKKGENLGQLLQARIGFELPCGGTGGCGKCKIKLVEGELEISQAEKKKLTEREISQGYRLACKCSIENNITIKVKQMNSFISSQEWEIEKIDTEAKYGIAIDAGSTTISGQLIDLKNKNILFTAVASNEQRKYGADIMSRIEYIKQDSIKTLNQSLKKSIYKVIRTICKQVNNIAIDKVNIVGNTFIHHCFGKFDVKELVSIPYQPASKKEIQTKAADLNWKIGGNPNISFLPVMDGFVGSDILAGIFSKSIPQKDSMNLFLDLGTNGEIALGNKDKIIFASTAAGPAFEAGNIQMGMRARKGAITKVRCKNKNYKTFVYGGGNPHGICGSGLIDTISCGLKLRDISPKGKIQSNNNQIEIASPVKIVQQDVREVQLAKGAVAAGIEILMDEININKAQIRKVYLAGAFGNYINVKSANRIGLLNFDEKKVVNAGNTALHGAVKSLFSDEYKDVLKQIEYLDLSSRDDFQKIYIKNMKYPENE